jgi:hypothetical protein
MWSAVARYRFYGVSNPHTARDKQAPQLGLDRKSGGKSAELQAIQCYSWPTVPASCTN